MDLRYWRLAGSLLLLYPLFSICQLMSHTSLSSKSCNSWSYVLCNCCWLVLLLLIKGTCSSMMKTHWCCGCVWNQASLWLSCSMSIPLSDWQDPQHSAWASEPGCPCTYSSNSGRGCFCLDGTFEFGSGNHSRFDLKRMFIQPQSTYLLKQLCFPILLHSAMSAAISNSLHWIHLLQHTTIMHPLATTLRMG